MTVMIGRFFGMPQELIRSGIWKQMRPGEKDLYVCLLHRSERYRTRTITISDATVEEEVGAATRTCCNARKKLQERGLITYKREKGSSYTYELCDPKARQPYPLPTDVPVIAPKEKRNNKQSGLNAKVAASPQVSPPCPESSQREPSMSPRWDEIGKL
jgi:hypothetical protein